MKTALLLCAIGMSFPIPASNPEGGLILSYQLEEPHRLDLRKSVTCTAVSAVTLQEEDLAREFGQDTLVAQVNRATAKLKLRVTKGGLMVEGEDKTREKYKVTNQGELFLGALFSERSVPVVKSILIDRERGHATLTTNGEKHSESVFFVCN